MAQNFTSFTPIEEAEPQAPATFTSFTPIEEEPAWTQNYVPRQPQGPVRTLPTVLGQTFRDEGVCVHMIDVPHVLDDTNGDDAVDRIVEAQ